MNTIKNSKLTIQQLKIYFILIEIASKNGLNSFDIKIKDIIKKLNVKGNNYQHCKDELNGYNNINYSSNTLGINFNIFTIHQKGNNIYNIIINNTYIDNIKMFNNITFDKILGMTSIYSIKAYLLFDKNIINYNTNINLEELKINLLGEEGIYKLYSHFREKVLNAIIKDYKNNLDIELELIERKEVRKVIDIQFKKKSEKYIKKEKIKRNYTHGYIYKISNKENDKIYIGKTNQHFASRWKQHFKNIDKKSTFYNDYLQYGLESFQFELVESFSLKDISFLSIDIETYTFQREQ